MSLKGTLKEFTITNILQMISVEKKTGVLAVRKKQTTITISFSKGSVVYAVNDVKEPEIVLKKKLMKNNFITETDWNKSSLDRSKTLKPLYESLKRYVRKDVLSFLLDNQIKDAIFQLLRWENGEYVFNPQEINFDPDLISPLDVQFLLMEGCRVADEWNSLEEKLSVIKKYLKKNIIPETTHSSTELPENERKKLEIEIISRKKISLSEEEENILMVLDNSITLDEIIDISMYDTFTTCTSIEKFLSLSIVKPERKKWKRKTTDSPSSSSSLRKGLDLVTNLVVLLLVLTLTAWGVYNVAVNFNQNITFRKKNIYFLKRTLGKMKLSHLERSIEHYSLLKQSYPETTIDMLDSGLLDNHLLYFLWSPHYKYLLNKEGKSYSISLIDNNE